MRNIRGTVAGIVARPEKPDAEGGDVELRGDAGFEPDERTAKELALAVKESDAGEFVTEATFWKQVRARRGK